jgi:hypothetical protein
VLKGTVQRKLTGVESDINQKVSAAKAKICGLSTSMGRPLQITDSSKPTS